MKRIVLCTLAVLLFLTAIAGPARTETRTQTLWLEGQLEEVLLTRYESRLGFALWYDTAFFLPESQTEDSETERFIRPGDQDDAYELSLYRAPAGNTPTAVARDEALALLSGPEAIAQARESTGVFGGRDSFGVYVVSDGLVREVYGVRTASAFYYITLSCPLDAMEDWGSRAYDLLQSIEWDLQISP